MPNWLAQHLVDHPELARLPIYKRSRNSLHMQQPDGSVIAEFTGRPMHYQDEHGVWQALDTTLRPIGNEYGAPGLDVFIAADGNVRLAGTKHQQKTGQFVILDVVKGKTKDINAKLVEARIEGDSVLRDAGTYQHRLRVTPTGMREELTINEPLSGTSAAEWAMLETEIIGRSLPDGWVDSLAWAGKFSFKLPSCIDANGGQVQARQYALTAGNRQMLYTGVPLAWLAGAAYPVVLDPDFSSSTADGYVSSDTNYYGYADARATAGYFSAGDVALLVGQTKVSGKSTYWNNARTFLVFDTSSISPSTLLAATLRVASYYTTTAPDDIEITKLDWSAYNPLSSGNMEAAFDAALSATKDVDLCLSGSALTANSYRESVGLALGQIATGGSTYFGLLSQKDRDAVEPAGSEVVSWHAGDGTYPPILRVIYGTPAPSAPVSISPMRGNIG